MAPAEGCYLAGLLVVLLAFVQICTVAGQVNATQAAYLDPDALTAITNCFNLLNGQCPDSPVKMAGGDPFFNVTTGTTDYLMKEYCWASCIAARNKMATCADNVISQYNLNSTMAPLYYPPSEAQALIATANVAASARSLSSSTSITTSTTVSSSSNLGLADQILVWCEANDPNLQVVMYSGAATWRSGLRFGLFSGLIAAVALTGL